MISVDTETIVSFAEAAKRLKTTRGGTSLHPNTIWRWANRGLKGPDTSIVRLETTKLGGRNFTSVEALQRFFDRLSHNHNDTVSGSNIPKEQPGRCPKRQIDRTRAASAKLRALGF